MALHPKKAEAGVWRVLGDVGAGAAVWSAGRQHKAQISFPGTVSALGLGSRWRSGVVLLTGPVDVLEEGHGEGHAQNLKDTGNGL